MIKFDMGLTKVPSPNQKSTLIISTPPKYEFKDSKWLAKPGSLTQSIGNAKIARSRYAVLLSSTSLIKNGTIKI